jgi:hypothetical protein
MAVHVDGAVVGSMSRCRMSSDEDAFAVGLTGVVQPVLSATRR